MAILRTALLALQIALGCWAAIGAYDTRLGPLALNPLAACWIVLWSLEQISPERACGPFGDACGAIGLLCHNQALALICFMPCLIENQGRLPFRHRTAANRSDPHAHIVLPSGQRGEPAGKWWSGAWQTGLLAPAACCLAATALFAQPVKGGILSSVTSGAAAIVQPLETVSSSPLVPFAALALLPAFAATPVLAYSLLVPALLAQGGMFWPVSLVLIGGSLSLFLPLSRALSFWPLFLLGIALSARAGGLADCALAGSEAFILALALQGLKGRACFLQAPLPPLAGFLPFWLGLHAINGLTGLSPAWTAGGMILSLTLGVVMVRAWLASWQTVSRICRSDLAGSPGRNNPAPGNNAEAAVSFGVRGIPSLTLGLCLSVCPGLLIGFLHAAILIVAGVPQDFWRSWPVWSVAGGDGAFWYPALVFLIPALIAPAFITHLPSLSAPIPDWPSSALRVRLPWSTRRLLASIRRRITLTRHVLLRQSRAGGTTPGSAGLLPLRPDLFITRHALVLWLLLIAVALSWMGWTA
ncbi:hypothetical protein [Asaia bogorensis]|uniref:hypothetical protein n=1 Tax=Asaia bogorensis TaxID=91915 RepID=UPI000EFD8720|nr:hypothetical protein [Asaia bogorensis]